LEGEFVLDEAIQILERTPATVRGLLDDLPPEWLDYQEDPEAWSPRTVLIHLIHNERTNWIPRARVILSDQERREFAPFRQLPQEGVPSDRPIGDLLSEFDRLRSERLRELHGLGLKTADFDRQGIHPTLGTVTLRQLLATWVAHDLNHLHQIAKTLAKRYQETVGPWRKNLGILNI
jgi:hypothetical protein